MKIQDSCSFSKFSSCFISDWKFSVQFSSQFLFLFNLCRNPGNASGSFVNPRKHFKPLMGKISHSDLQVVVANSADGFTLQSPNHCFSKWRLLIIKDHTTVDLSSILSMYNSTSIYATFFRVKKMQSKF